MEIQIKPYCFVITSFGEKENLNDLKAKAAAVNVRQINFDKIYSQLIEPAIQKADLVPLIEREEQGFGIIHKTMYEKIILAEFCIADLTNANPNVYYELGMRYATKPYTTIPVVASSHMPLPFDVAPNRVFVYQVDSDFNLVNKENDLNSLVAVLQNAKLNRNTDSPLYDLVNGISFHNSVAHEKTDIFRDKVIYDAGIKEELAYSRALTDTDPSKEKKLRIGAINAIVQKYRPLENIETAVLIDMMISYRNIGAFNEMLLFIEELPRYVFETVMVQEQYAFVLNRLGGNSNPPDVVMISKAENALKGLEEKGKASSETYGIWGRIFKDKYDRAYTAGKKGEAEAHLENACELYKKGFEFDPRDAYPGVNYITCLELLGEDERKMRLLPAVEYAVLTKMKRKQPDYWDYATLMELSVIENKLTEAEKLFYKAKTLLTEAWMTDTTKANLEKILNRRKDRGLEVDGLASFMKDCFV